MTLPDCHHSRSLPVPFFSQLGTSWRRPASQPGPGLLATSNLTHWLLCEHVPPSAVPLCFCTHCSLSQNVPLNSYISLKIALKSSPFFPAFQEVSSSSTSQALAGSPGRCLGSHSAEDLGVCLELSLPSSSHTSDCPGDTKRLHCRSNWPADKNQRRGWGSTTQFFAIVIPSEPMKDLAFPRRNTRA